MATGGFLGVNMFFVLSGFLITSLLLGEWARRLTVRLGQFWARRARRLLPALLLLLVGVAAYARFFATPGEFASLRLDSLSTLFYVANWHFIMAGTNYFSAAAQPSPLSHMWSLAIEEQFYIVWPPVVLVLLTRRSAAATVAPALPGAGAPPWSAPWPRRPTCGGRSSTVPRSPGCTRGPTPGQPGHPGRVRRWPRAWPSGPNAGDPSRCRYPNSTSSSSAGPIPRSAPPASARPPPTGGTSSVAGDRASSRSRRGSCRVRPRASPPRSSGGPPWPSWSSCGTD